MATKIIDLITKVKRRAGVEGDPFFNDPDEILAIIQTSFENHWYLLASKRPNELERSVAITGAATVALPSSVAVVRGVMLNDGQTPLHRLSRHDFSTSSTAYDFDSSNLYFGDNLTAEELTLIYLPQVPQLARSNPSDTVWTEIDERLFPENSIVLDAISELKGKDDNPASQTYMQKAQASFMLWSQYVFSARMASTVDGSTSIASMVNQVFQLSEALTPSHASEHAALTILQQGVDRIHRAIEIVAESVIRKSLSPTGTFSANPYQIMTPADLQEILLVLVTTDGSTYEPALSGDVSTHPGATRAGSYFYSYDTLGAAIKVFRDAAMTVPTGITLSYLATAPTLTLDGVLNIRLYPRDLVVDYALGQVAKDKDIRTLAAARFEQNLPSWVMTLRQRHITRGLTAATTRAGLIATIRALLGSGLESEWRDQYIEMQIDLAKETIARYIRSMYMGFHESQKSYTLSDTETEYTPADTWLQIIRMRYLPQGHSDANASSEVHKRSHEQVIFQYVAGFWDNRGQDFIFSGKGLGPGTLLVDMTEPPATLAGNYSASDLDRLLYPPDLMTAMVVADILNSPTAPADSARSAQYYANRVRELKSEHIRALNGMFRREIKTAGLAFPMPQKGRGRMGYMGGF